MSAYEILIVAPPLLPRKPTPERANQRRGYNVAAWPASVLSHWRKFIDVELSVLADLRSIRMLDLILLALGLGFFALAVGYTIACDRL